MDTQVDNQADDLIEETNRLFGEEKTSVLFRKAAGPGAISMLASSLYSIFEGSFIGHYLGAVPFAAVNFAMPVVIINFAVADLIGVGSSVPISIALGRKEHDKANNVFTCSVILIILAAAIMGVLLFFLTPWMVRLMGAEGELADMAVNYIRVYAVTAPVTTMVFAFDNYLRISGKIRFSMWLNIAMSGMTVVFIYLFLAVFKLGLIGAAAAFPASLFICAVVGIIPFIQGKMVLHFTKPRFSFDMIKEIVACGSPNFLANIAGRVVALIMNSMLIRYGGSDAVAIYGILMYSTDLVQPLIYGTVDSLQPAIGYNLGAKLFDRVKELRKYCFLTAAAISIVMGGIITIFPKQVTGLFLSADNAAILEESVRAMRIFSVGFFFFWFGFSAQSFFGAVEQPKCAAILSLAGTFVFPLILLFALQPLKLTGLWMVSPITNFLGAVLGAILLKKMERQIFSKF